MQGRHRLRPPVIVATIGMVLGLGLPATVLAAVTVNLDQWASSDAAWQNGNLNGNNSRYPEGGIVPFRLALEGLKPGAHSIHINYDFTAGGHKAYDFLATWSVTNAKGKVCIPSGGAISSMCPSLPGSTTAAIPSDSFKANGLSVKGAEAYSGAPRRLTIWGGTITSISAPAHAGSVNGNSTADILVRFRSTGPAVLLAWGGHLAQSRYWDTAGGGARDGASLVSGAPWHMRTLKLDGAGNKNQDRSIQPSAIVGELPPQALAPTPPGAPATPRPRSAPIDPNSPAAPRGPLATVPPTSTVEPRVVTGSPTAGLFLAIALGTMLVCLSIASGWRRRTRPPD
ncbi:MAG TPA: hypothetical protein VFP66_05945 [Candidatus Limnocylindrales bacterium]|nr:hypothetical protein [Candidatus Limnocylindrales bacterium]